MDKFELSFTVKEIDDGIAASPKVVDMSQLAITDSNEITTVNDMIMFLFMNSLQTGNPVRSASLSDPNGEIRKRIPVTSSPVIRLNNNGILIDVPAAASTINGVLSNLSGTVVLYLENGMFVRCETCMVFGDDNFEIFVVATKLSA